MQLARFLNKLFKKDGFILIDGNSKNTMYPILAGQYKNYLVNTLHAYRSGKRNNAIMSGFATGLTNQDIDDLATYFSNQKGLKILPVK